MAEAILATPLKVLNAGIDMLGLSAPGRGVAAGALAVAVISADAVSAAWAQAEPVWTQSAEAPEGLLTPLEAQRHDFFIELAQSASSCSGPPLSERCMPGGIDIVFFGRTQTEMWWWENRGMAVWEEVFGARKAVNFGSQGTRPESLLWRMRNGELDGYQAKLVVLQALGPTDRISRDELAEPYAPIIGEIRSRQRQARIVIFAHSPSGAPQVGEANAEAHARIVDNETVFYADIGERFVPEAHAFEVWAEALELWLQPSVN